MKDFMHASKKSIGIVSAKEKTPCKKLDFSFDSKPDEHSKQVPFMSAPTSSHLNTPVKALAVPGINENPAVPLPFQHTDHPGVNNTKTAPARTIEQCQKQQPKSVGGTSFEQTMRIFQKRVDGTGIMPPKKRRFSNVEKFMINRPNVQDDNNGSTSQGNGVWSLNSGRPYQITLHDMTNMDPNHLNQVNIRESQTNPAIQRQQTNHQHMFHRKMPM